MTPAVYDCDILLCMTIICLFVIIICQCIRWDLKLLTTYIKNWRRTRSQPRNYETLVVVTRRDVEMDYWRAITLRIEAVLKVVQKSRADSPHLFRSCLMVYAETENATTLRHLANTAERVGLPNAVIHDAGEPMVLAYFPGIAFPVDH